MSEIRRITPEEVLEAYRVTGMEPCRGVFGDDKHGCALSALYRAERGNSRWLFASQLCDKLGLNAHYMSGFIRGWDGKSQIASVDGDALCGYEDGVACARAVFGEGQTE